MECKIFVCNFFRCHYFSCPLRTKSPGTDSGPEASRVLGPGTGEPSLALATESGMGTLFPGTDSGPEASGEPGESFLFLCPTFGGR